MTHTTTTSTATASLQGTSCMTVSAQHCGLRDDIFSCIFLPTPSEGLLFLVQLRKSSSPTKGFTPKREQGAVQLFPTLQRNTPTRGFIRRKTLWCNVTESPCPPRKTHKCRKAPMPSNTSWKKYQRRKFQTRETRVALQFYPMPAKQ